MPGPPDKEIKKRTTAFIASMNKVFKALAAKYEKESPEGEEVCAPLFSLVEHTSSTIIARSAKQHVKALLSNKSWTFTSRHLSNAASHVLVKKDGKVVWDIDKAVGWEPYDFENVKKLWVAAMKQANLRNYQDKVAWGTSDVCHLQLPDSKPKITDALVVESIKLYMTETRKNGKKKNKTLEKDFAKTIAAYEKKMGFKKK